MPLKPDRTYLANGIKINEYLLTKHNPNNIDMPWADLPKVPLGITVHNTPKISVSGTTMSEQYTRATINGNMGDVRVHFYVDENEAWQNLPLTLSGWHAADGDGNGNRKTIAIECIMDGSNSTSSKKAEDNCARLVAYLLDKYKLDNGAIYSHNHWYSKKYCPAYILPHWESFKKKCISYRNKNSTTTTTIAKNITTTSSLYRIRKSWEDTKSQIGAFTTLENAKKAWKNGYKIYDNTGKQVYPTPIASNKNINVTYRVFTKGKWLPEVVNCNDLNENGYAGMENCSITALAAKASEGTLKYRVHIVNGGWLSWISKMNIGDWFNGYAGIQNSNIDAIQIKFENVSGYEAKYRVSTTNSKNYLDWVLGVEDYAGIMGQPIDKIQIKIVKK